LLIIRLRRTGKKGQPSYRIVVADQRKSVYSPYVEMLGHYDPQTKVIVLNREKAEAWMKKGAKPSNTVAKIFEKQGLKHKSIVIKKFRAVSKKELEAQKAQEEAERAKAQAAKEAAKAAFEQQVEAEKAAQSSSEEKLKEAAEATIKEEKAVVEPKAGAKPSEGEFKEEKAKPESKDKESAEKDKK